jgi:hypothetical protein
VHPAKLQVVTCISNPMRYESRVRLYRRFAEHMHASGVTLTTVELQYGERPFQVTEAGNPHHVQLRVPVVDGIWRKEDLLNIGIAHLPADWKYVAWIDADVFFARHDWASETVQMLQQYAVMQLFSEALDLDPHHRPMPTRRFFQSFMYSYQHGVISPNGRYDNHDHHPGYAWACTRHAYEALGGLIDFAILGSADRHMAMGLVGLAKASMPKGISPAYRDAVLGWQDRAEAHIHRRVGYLPGLIHHGFHGPKPKRNYGGRWHVLAKYDYNPARDIVHDRGNHGIIRWGHEHSARMRGLRDATLRYHADRDEDSTSLV